MFAWMPIKWRVRAAGFAVALYAVCLGMPTAVMAFSQSSIPEHCLTDEQNAGIVHVHQNGTTHHHSGGKHDDGDDHSIKCCGLFSVSAIPPDIIVLPLPRLPDDRHSTIAANNSTGRGSERIDRPPRSHSSL